MTTLKEVAVLSRPSNETGINISGQTFQLGEQVCLQATRPVKPALLAVCGSRWRRATRT